MFSTNFDYFYVHNLRHVLITNDGICKNKKYEK